MTRVAISSRLLLLAILLGGASLGGACGSGEKRAAAARASQWESLERERQALGELRSQLLAARAEGTADRARDLEGEVGASTDRYLEHLVAFINRHAEGRAGAGAAPAAPEVTGAIRAKSAEDLLRAREYIELGGDYAEAIDIVEDALAVDPANPELSSALEEAKRLRYMDAERFSRIEPGMTEDEVRQEIGQVQPSNVRRSDDGRVVTWLYPRAQGAAAAVFFEMGAQGSLRVYDSNFEAVAASPDGAAEPAGNGESAAD